MKRTLFGLFASLAVAGTLVAAQDVAAPPASSPQVPASQDQKKPDTTLTGCLVQGSTPTIFILDDAKTSTDGPSVKGKTYIVEAANAPIDFKAQLNHRVSIVGIAELRLAAEAPMPEGVGQKVNEKDLPKLSAKSVLKLADTCSVG